MHSGMAGWSQLVVLFDLAVFTAVLGALVAVLSGGKVSRILAERYARGEIDEDEYHRRRAILRRGR
ncbi:SHOCT domain-containing protein [Virgisporangium aliadipatigenens]|nr:SHOCT domain-containing protein [Virgisporangium aliadipatigenens]